jgi:GNAT superfamily N-acetyltransferase
MGFTLRRATACDADAIVNVHWASFRLLTFLPMLHTIEENRRFIANVILKECEVTVAEDETGIVAFLALGGEEIRLLYTCPDRIGMGAGTQLIDAAKASGIDALELWCLQANERARRFYEARGFRPIRYTDGCGQRGADARHPLSVEIFWRRPASSTRENRAGARGRHTMPERVSVEQAVTRVSKGVQPSLMAIDGLPCSLEQNCLRRCADAGQADRH